MPYRERWSVILWKRPSGESREVWAERVVRTLRTLERLAGVTEWEIPGEEDAVGIEADTEAITALIEENVNVNDIGERMEDFGKRLTFFGSPRVEGEWHLVAHLVVEEGTPHMSNSCIVEFAVPVVPDPARAIFEELVELWAPLWGALEWRANYRVRDRELTAAGVPQGYTMDRILHWCTFLSSEALPRERVERLNGLDGIEALPRNGGTELVLGDAWRTPEALLAAQRRFEPLISD